MEYSGLEYLALDSILKTPLSTDFISASGMDMLSASLSENIRFDT
jgi:hypothetical protein